MNDFFSLIAETWPHGWPKLLINYKLYLCNTYFCSRGSNIIQDNLDAQEGVRNEIVCFKRANKSMNTNAKNYL